MMIKPIASVIGFTMMSKASGPKNQTKMVFAAIPYTRPEIALTTALIMLGTANNPRRIAPPRRRIGAAAIPNIPRESNKETPVIIENTSGMVVNAQTE